MFWETYNASEIAQDQIWTPDLTLKMMGRDYAAAFSAFSWELATATASGAWADWFTVGVCWPEDLDGDASFPCSMRLHLNFTAKGNFGVGDPNDGLSIRIGTDSPEVTMFNTTGTLASRTVAVYAYKTYPAGSVPTGATSVVVQADFTWANYFEGYRSYANDPISWIGPVLE